MREKGTGSCDLVSWKRNDLLTTRELHRNSRVSSVASVDDLRTVLKIANETKIPLWIVSRGKNMGYGGPAPVVPGSVILDLHRINSVIEVNEKLAYAVVEPGVTFTDLYKYCAERKLKVWPSTASLGWGSVIGNVRS